MLLPFPEPAEELSWYMQLLESVHNDVRFWTHLSSQQFFSYYCGLEITRTNETYLPDRQGTVVLYALAVESWRALLPTVDKVHLFQIR